MSVIFIELRSDYQTMEPTQITKISACSEHMNIGVSNWERHIEFYDKALCLKEVEHRIEAPDGSFIIVSLGKKRPRRKPIMLLKTSLKLILEKRMKLSFVSTFRETMIRHT